jgi:TIGR03009 family protein
MATCQTSSFLQHLRRALRPRDDGHRTDAELLNGFFALREEACFEALVRRHGPMVLGVCRRLLRDAHDAEDAFQATFLVLVRKAGSIVPRQMVGNWLYGVAYRTALKAKGAIARRRVKERPLRDLPGPPAGNEAWRELRPVLDQELHRLPEKYRVPVVLCILEGQSRKAAAEQLGWPEGTLSGRLARARTLLAKRLTRHGLSLPGGALGFGLSGETLAAAVTGPLLVRTVKAAVLTAAGQAAAAGVIPVQVIALTEGVMKAMLVTKLKVATAVLLVAGIGIGTATFAGHPGEAAREEQASQLQPARRGKTPAKDGVKEPPAADAKEPKIRPDPPEPATEADAKLDKVLREWARAADSVKQMHYCFRRTEADRATNDKTILTGEAFVRKPDLLRIETRDDTGELWDLLVCKGKEIHQFSPISHTQNVFMVPESLGFPEKPERYGGNWVERGAGRMLELLSWEYRGYPVRDLKARFEMRLTKEDEYYTYLEFTPRSKSDRDEFRRMRVVLMRERRWVRQFWMEAGNGRTVTLDYEEPDTNPKPPVTPESIMKNLPEGWKRTAWPIGLKKDPSDEKK